MDMPDVWRMLFRWSTLLLISVGITLVVALSLMFAATGQKVPKTLPKYNPGALSLDADRDGLTDYCDDCPMVKYIPGFDWGICAPMDQNPHNDPQPECKARERVVQMLLSHQALITHIAFAVVKDGKVHFADAFEYIGQNKFVHNPDGVNRLYRIGSTSKPVTAVTAKILEESAELSFDDFVNDDDASQKLTNGQRTLRHLLTHDGAFHLDSGSVHLFCYDGDLAAFWVEPDDLVSPHYDSAKYGNLGGGYEYSAFNYSLAGAYLANRTGECFKKVLQARLFDPAGMCTAMLDGARGVKTSIGHEAAVSEGPVMHIGPYINLISPTDPRCEDNFYSSEDLPGDDYTWQYYHLDEADARARDPAGGVIASVIDMANFASALLDSYHGPNGLLSQQGIRELWTATQDLPGCPYQPYYGIGFFTNDPDGQEITEVEHGGSRAGYTSAFVIRPEANTAISILANADVSTVAISDLAKAILDDF